MRGEGYKPSKAKIDKVENLMSNSQRKDSLIRTEIIPKEFARAVGEHRSKIDTNLNSLDTDLKYFDNQGEWAKSPEVARDIEIAKRISLEIRKKMEELSNLKFGSKE